MNEVDNYYKNVKLVELTITIVTSQEAEAAEAVIREALFGKFDISEIIVKDI